MTVSTTINDYLYAGSLFVIGAFGAFAFTSYTIVNKDYKHLQQKIKEDDKKRDDEEVKQHEEEEANSYENKFSLKTAIHNKNHCNLTEKHIFEATPDGVVILNYDDDNKSFNYWSDNTIQYKYLQTVARRFVYEYQCKDYYIRCDEKDKPEPSCVCDSKKCKLPPPITIEEPVDRDYNKAEQDLKHFRDTSDTEPKKNEDDNLFIKTKKNGQKTIAVVANKYSHKGNLIDFYGQPSKQKTTKNISFTDFMKRKCE